MNRTSAAKPDRVRGEILALIPARGGSKGIPRKNVRLVGGKPLVVHSIEQALASRRVTRVLVSTDDEEIARVSRAAGAEVIERPADLSGDTASSESALTHAMETLTRDGASVELVVFLQATSPLRQPGDIDAAIATLEEQQADSLFSACPVHGFVWRQAAASDQVGQLQEPSLRSLTYDFQQRPRRQDIGEDWLENGSIYIFRAEILRRHANRLGGKIAIFPMHPLDSFQVDEPEDLELMESLLALRSSQPGRRAVPDDSTLAAVRLLILDFDGVLTDDRVLVDQEGREAVFCHRGDGLGLERLRKQGKLEIRVLSRETNPVVAARCRKLGLDFEQSCTGKRQAVAQLAEERGLEPHEIAFMGNDVNDLEALNWVGVAIAPADARPEIRQVANWITQRAGGRGAVREVCDRLLSRTEEPSG